MKVISTTLGLGTILSQDENNVTIDFNGQIKTLVIKFARLTNEDGTPFGNEFIAPIKKSYKKNAANFSSEMAKIDLVATKNHKDAFNKNIQDALEAETGRKGTLEFLKSL